MNTRMTPIPAPKITHFNNGIRLVTENMPGIYSAAIGIWIKRGSRHEHAHQNGVAHFLEHMAFKGTKSRTALEIAEAIEDVGGDINAYTSQEATAYYVRILPQNLPLALDILADILLEPAFAPHEIERERDVILQEIGQANDTPDDIIFDWLTEETYPNQALGRPILGRLENVQNFDVPDLRGFIGAHYGGPNMIISAAGLVDHEKIAKQVEARFATLAYGTDPIQSGASFHSGQKRVKKSLEQAHFAMTLPAPTLIDTTHHAAQLISVILGGGMSSRLFQTIREKMGLCYTIFSSYSPGPDHGELTIYAGTSPQGIDPLMEAVATTLRDFHKDIKDKEIARVKAQMRAGAVMGLESVLARAERNAKQLIFFDRLFTIQENLDEIEAVTHADIQSLSAHILTQEPQMVLYGKIDKARDYSGFVDVLRREV